MEYAPLLQVAVATNTTVCLLNYRILLLVDFHSKTIQISCILSTHIERLAWRSPRLVLGFLRVASNPFKIPQNFLSLNNVAISIIMVEVKATYTYQVWRILLFKTILYQGQGMVSSLYAD